MRFENFDLAAPYGAIELRGLGHNWDLHNFADFEDSPSILGSTSSRWNGRCGQVRRMLGETVATMPGGAAFGSAGCVFCVEPVVTEPTRSRSLEPSLESQRRHLSRVSTCLNKTGGQTRVSSD